MHITFDPAKDEANRAKHGVSLALADELEWESALIWEDLRHQYNETRYSALGRIGNRLYFVAFTPRGITRRIISMRKANDREVRIYVSQR